MLFKETLQRSAASAISIFLAGPCCTTAPLDRASSLLGARLAAVPDRHRGAPHALITDCAELGQVYSVRDSPLCLTGTAEVPLAAVAMDAVLSEGELPLRLAAFGHCFRTEAGAAGAARPALCLLPLNGLTCCPVMSCWQHVVWAAEALHSGVDKDDVLLARKRRRIG